MRGSRPIERRLARKHGGTAPGPRSRCRGEERGPSPPRRASCPRQLIVARKLAPSHPCSARFRPKKGDPRSFKFAPSGLRWPLRGRLCRPFRAGRDGPHEKPSLFDGDPRHDPRRRRCAVLRDENDGRGRPQSNSLGGSAGGSGAGGLPCRQKPGSRYARSPVSRSAVAPPSPARGTFDSGLA